MQAIQQLCSILQASVFRFELMLRNFYFSQSWTGPFKANHPAPNWEENVRSNLESLRIVLKFRVEDVQSRPIIPSKNMARVFNI